MSAAESIAEWLRDRLDVAVENGPELRLRECLFCGRPRTMKVNVERRKFICFHQDCAQAGSLLRLVQAVENCTFDEAMGIVKGLLRGLARGHRRPEALAENLRRLQTEGETEEAPDKLHHDLPEEFIPCWDGNKWRVPRYLKHRRVQRDLIKRFGIGFAEEGDAAGRVIVPIVCADAFSWVARKIDPDD